MSKYFFGIDKQTGERIYLSKPTWDCGWYWSFGYLGNRDCHYHLSSYQEHGDKLRNKHMADCLMEDYELNPSILNNIWVFCELAKTAYSLKEAAEVLGRGGSHYTSNPCANIIKNDIEVSRINKEVLPAIFDEIDKLLK